jgi:hypothetical protein
MLGVQVLIQLRFTDGFASHAPMPWAQGVGRSNRPAPTKAFIFSVRCAELYCSAHLPQVQWTAQARIDNVGVDDSTAGKDQPVWLPVSTFSTTTS